MFVPRAKLEWKEMSDKDLLRCIPLYESSTRKMNQDPFSAEYKRPLKRQPKKGCSLTFCLLEI
eukprot:m.54382 g.54382  ORF g.54382 m.54382 type:complete len:63 (+) comp34361_c0_seq2:92-280(+)